MLWPVDPLPWVMDTATVLFVLNTGVYLAPSSLKYRCEIPSLTPLPVWSPCPSWFTGLEERAVVPHVCVAEGCCLSRPLTHHLSSHLPEQPNPATVQGVPFAPGFSPRQAEASPPFPMGCSTCARRQKDRGMFTSTLGPLFSGMSSCESKSPHDCGQLLCLHCACPCAWLQTDRQTDRHTCHCLE